MSGQITRKEIIEDEALKWGDLYAETLDKAIAKNKEFVQSIVALNAENVKLKRAENQTDFIKQKNDSRLASEQLINKIKEQQAEEIKLDKIKQEALKTEKLELDIANKKATAQKRSTQLTIEERVQNEVNNKLLKQAARENLGLIGAYEKLNKARTDAKNRLRDLMAAEEKNNSEIKKAQREFDVLEGKVRKADSAVNDFTKNVGNYPLQNAASGLKNLIGAFGLVEGISLFAGVMKGAYETIKQFDQGVADLQAITGATGKDLDFLKNSAIETGKGVKGGAIAVVEAYKLIASAKPELLENVNALNAVTEAAITLSQAAGIELPDAATALTDAMNQFNVPAEQAGEFVDTLANGAKYGAAEIPQITEALLKFGAVARGTNVSIKESTALIELLAENGIKGADAGTALRNVLLKISAPDALPRAAQQSLKDLGISFALLKDKATPIQEKFEALKPLLADNGKLLKAFGFENVVAAQNIIEHTDRLKELTGKMGEFGTAAEQAEIRMNTLNGKTEILSSTYDTFILSMGSGSGVVSNFFKFFVEGATNALNGLIRLNTSWDELFEKSKTNGQKKGKDLFESLYGESFKPLSASQKKAIEDKIKEIDKLIADASTSNQKAAELRGQKEGLQLKLIDSDKNATASRIKKVAESDYKEYEKQYKIVNKKINEFNKNSFAAALKYGISESDLNAEKERLLTLMNQEAEIIRQSRQKMSNKAVTPAEKTKTNVAENGDTDAEIKARLAKQKKEADEYLKILQNRIKSEFELNQFRLEREIYYNQLVVDDETKSIEERINASLNIEQLRKAQLDESLANEIRNNALSSENTKGLTKTQIEQLSIRTEAEIKALLQTGKLKQNATKEEILAYEKYQLEIKKINDKNLDNTQKLIDAQVAIVQKGIDRELLAQDTKLKDALTTENKLYQAQLELAQGNQEKIRIATENHERQVYEIKKKFALDALKLQILTLEKELADNDKKDVKEQVSADKRAEIANKLAGYKMDVSSMETDDYIKNTNEKEDAEKAFNDNVKQLASQLKDELLNFANALFEAKISNIDNEIQANDDFYSQQIELAGNDAAKKDLLQKEQAKKDAELQRKKRKAEYDQAVFNKAAQAAQIIGATSLAVISTLAQVPKFDFGISASTIAAIYAGIGAVQLATLLATPLPKYKVGRKGGPAEFAEVGDGYVSEVITDKDGSNVRITPAKPTFTYLKEGDIVHRSVEDYQNSVRTSLINDFDKNAENIKQYQIFINENSGLMNNDILDELRRNTKAIEQNKGKIIVQNKIDLGHELWRLSNINWNK